MRISLTNGLCFRFAGNARTRRDLEVCMNHEQFVRVVYVVVLSALVYGYLVPAIKAAYTKWVKQGCKFPDFFRRKRG